MSYPDSDRSNSSDRPAQGDQSGAVPGRAQRSSESDSPEAALGGADAVQKTSYGVGQGTDPDARPGDSPVAHPPTGHGPNFLAWGIGAVAALVAIIYLISALT